MIAYDPTLIHEFAERLYKRARGVVVSYGVLGFVLGGIGGFALGIGVSGPRGSGAMMMAVVVGIVGLAVGVVAGIEKAFWLKLEAQRALCQLQTEINTRHAPGQSHAQLRAG